MIKIPKNFSKLWSSDSAKKRRATLIQEMERLISQGIDCFQCVGTCCTDEANSMRITPLEAFELYYYLWQEGRWNKDLEESLSSCIAQYDLDREIFIKKDLPLRRKYTCPFYLGREKGCSISRKFKPYGCLAFNPCSAGQTIGGDCSHLTGASQSRSQQFELEEQKLNSILLDELGNGFWETLPIPTALLKLHHGLNL